METRILVIDPGDVKFNRADGPARHPFEDPELVVQEPTKARLVEAVTILKEDGVVAFPTETVYGLGANALSSAAVSKIYAAKNRPPDNPLILHIASLKSLRRLLPPHQPVIPPIYEPLIAKYWPGPLTILLPLDDVARTASSSSSDGISELCTSGQSTFAVRMPQHPLALALCHLADLPLAAPSANTSTRPSPTIAAHVNHDLQGRIPLILDGGSCDVGLESTVVDGLSHPPQILRPGGVSIEQVRAIQGWEGTVVHRPGVVSTSEVPRTPGMKYRHYSPTTAKVVLFEVSAAVPDAALLHRYGIDLSATVAASSLAICRTRRWPQELGDSLRLSLELSSEEVIGNYSMGTSGTDISRRLFKLLRELDDQGVGVVLVEGIEEADEGLAVMNRLRKAASLVIH